MKKISYILIFLFTVSCNIVDSNFPNEISSTFGKKPFLNYDQINKTNSKIIQDLRFEAPGIGFETQLSFSIKDPCGQFGSMGECYPTLYYFDTRSYVVLDYNKDGKKDIFGHLEDHSPDLRERNSNYNWWIRGPGKFILVSDYRGDASIRYYDSPVVYDVRMDLGDFNNDGIEEIILSSLDTHNGTPPEYYDKNWPLKLVTITLNGDVSWMDITEPTHSNAVETGDIDGDGDIDFVYIEQRNWARDSNIPNILRFMINQGNNNFIHEPHRLKETEMIIQSNAQFHNTGEIHLFDVNRDGCIDITLGDTRTINHSHYYNGQEVKFVEGGGIRILYNDCRGNFSIIDNSVHVPITINNKVNGTTIFDIRYFDYDLDSDYDLFILYQLNTSSNIIGNEIEVFENTNGIFNEVSDELFPAGNELIAKNINSSWDAYEHFPHFFGMTFVDFDRDGQFDIVPTGRNFPINSNIEKNDYMDGDEYYKNINGKYFFVKGKNE